MNFSFLSDAWARRRDQKVRRAFAGMCWAGVLISLTGDPLAPPEADAAKAPKKVLRRPVVVAKRKPAARPAPSPVAAPVSAAAPQAAAKPAFKAVAKSAPVAAETKAAPVAAKPSPSAVAQKTQPVMPPRPPAKPDVEYEPPPQGEVAVQWASPKSGQGSVKVRAYPSHGSPSLGDMHAGSAIALLPDAAKKGGAGCRGWLSVLPDGFVCADQVVVKSGYLSSPPPQERANGWQRMRYGVVRADSAVLSSQPKPAAPSGAVREAGYLRGTLRRGDGVTIVRERDEHVQIWSRHWLRRTDVTVSVPSPLVPINLQALPVGQRMMLAWIVPPPGETQARLYLPGGTPSVFLPRYTPIYCSEVRPGSPLRSDGRADGRAGSEHGRATVHLSDDARLVLAGKPEAQAAAFEIDASLLRRVTPATLPKNLQPDERWVDISLSDQVAVAYQGETPLFAALVSTGAHGATPPGTFWVYRKYVTQTMANLRGAASQYDYREVPHAQFFNGRIGLHAVLWHDLLGHAVSHGCVNMSPATAEQFFSFTKPDLPSGWHTVNGDPPTRGAPWLRGTRIVVRK